MNNGNFNINSQGNSSNWENFTSGSVSLPNQPQTVGFSTQTTVSTSEGSLSNETKLYLNPSFKPALLPSGNDNPSVAEAALDQMYNFDKLLQNIIQINGTPLPGSPGEEYLAELAKIPVDDPEIIAMAEKQNISAGQLFNGVQVKGQSLFNRALSTLPQQLADKLLFAHNNPEAAKNLSPEETAQLKEIEKQVTEQLRTEYSFSADWKGVPTDNTDFNQSITNSFDDEFDAQLQTLKDSGQITEKQALQIRSLHYQTTDKATADPALVKIQENLETTIATNLRTQYGADESWQPHADVTFNSYVLNGRFQVAFQTTLDNFTPPLTAENKALVIKSFANPDDPSIPPEIKEIAKSIQATATQTVITENGLPPTWTTTATSAVSLNPNAVRANSAMATLKEGFSYIENYVKTLPDGPDKVSYMDFLKVIGAAISKLQEALYAIQSADSAQSKKLSNAKMDLALNQISIQQQKADEVKEKMQKMAGLGPLKSMFEWLIKIIMLIIGFMLGPVMFAIVLTYQVDSTKAQVEKTSSLFQEMFKAIADKTGPGPAAAINMALSFAISMGNPLLLIQLISQDSRCFQNFVAMCGGDKSTQEMVNSIAGMILQMSIMLPLMFMSGGGAAPMEAVDAVAKFFALSADEATRLVKASSISVSVIMASLEVSKSGVQINNNVLQAQIEMIKADAESYSEEAKAMIQILKKLIQKLLDLLNSRSEFILDLSNFQSKKYNDLENITTELFS